MSKTSFEEVEMNLTGKSKEFLFPQDFQFAKRKSKTNKQQARNEGKCIFCYKNVK